MTRKEEINDYIANYLEQYNGDSYEAYAEKEDIAHACQNAIEWADRTNLDKLGNAIEKLLSGYIIRNFNFGNSYDIDKLIEDFKYYMKGE